MSKLDRSLHRRSLINKDISDLRLVGAVYKHPEYPGIDKTAIILQFNSSKELYRNCILTADVRDGHMLVAESVEGNICYCKLVTLDKKAWYKHKYLVPGTEYFIIEYPFVNNE